MLFESIPLPFFLNYGLMVLLFLIWGSFIGGLYYRIPQVLLTLWHAETTPIRLKFRPRSYCPHCRTTLLWRHLLPLVSFIWLKGQCHWCQRPIDRLYFSLELLTLFVLVYLGFVSTSWTVFFTFAWFFSILILLSGIDQKHFLLPDILTLPLLWSGLALQALANPVLLAHSILTICVLGLALTALTVCYEQLRQKEVFGRGDIKLILALCAWFDLQTLLWVILFASCIALGARMVFAVKRGWSVTQTTPFPFGPYLFLGSFLAHILF